MESDLKKAPDLCILITNHNTADFIEIGLEAIQKLTARPFRVLISDNQSNFYHRNKLKSLEKKFPFVEVFYRRTDKGGAAAHADALDFLIEKSRSPYTAVFDSDCFPLMKGWDEYLIGMLSDRVKIVGSPPLQKAQIIRPTDFPLMFVILFDTAVFKSLKISSAPRDIAKGEDTCWEWRGAFLKAGFEGKIVRAENTRFYKQGVFKEFLCAEYYTDDGRLMASHFGRGSTVGAAKYDSLLFKIPFCGKVLRRMKGEVEKNRWMHQCQEIFEKNSVGRCP